MSSASSVTSREADLGEHKLPTLLLFCPQNRSELPSQIPLTKGQTPQGTEKSMASSSEPLLFLLQIRTSTVHVWDTDQPPKSHPINRTSGKYYFTTINSLFISSMAKERGFPTISVPVSPRSFQQQFSKVTVLWRQKLGSNHQYFKSSQQLRRFCKGMCQAVLIANEQTAELIKFDLMICHHP